MLWVCLFGIPFFLFRRGGTRVKVWDYTNAHGVLGSVDSTGFNQPTLDYVSSTVPVANISIPYISGAAFVANRATSATNTGPKFQYNAGTGTALYFVGGADDYSLHYVFPPVIGTVAKNNSFGFSAALTNK